jgi:vacuolar-type H+-ATPase subunit I/STV1
MKDIPNVNVKSTKNKILEALNIAKQNLAELDAQLYDPQHDKAEKQLSETLTKANSLNTSSIENKITDLQSNVIDVLSSLISGIKNEKLEYDNLTNAIEAKKIELTDLYVIEDELSKFAIIVNAKHATIKELDEKISELANLKSEKQAELDTMEKEWETEQKKIRDREKQDYDYEFSRQK